MSNYYKASQGTIHYKMPEVDPSKPIIFFIHGANPDSQNTEFWAPILEIMERYCVPVRIDSYGHGKTEFNGKRADFKTKADGMRELILHIIDENQSSTFAIVGRSLGGAITQYLVSDPEFADKITGIGLIAPAAGDRVNEFLGNWRGATAILWDTTDPIVSFNNYEYFKETVADFKLFTVGPHGDAFVSVSNTKSPTHAPELVYPQLFKHFMKYISESILMQSQ